jgi:hypothetical protein
MATEAETTALVALSPTPFAPWVVFIPKKQQTVAVI